MSSLKVSPLTKPISGTLSVPGDKSISHRALILASIAEGTSIIENLSDCDDVKRTIVALRQLGVSIYKRKGVWKVKGGGLHGLKKSRKIIQCGNSGTTLRLLTGLLAAQTFESKLTGDASLNKRPMQRLIVPLKKMGAKISEVRSAARRIIKIDGHRLKGARHHLPVASAQVKTALLLAGLYAEGKTLILEPFQSRDHTERMMSLFGKEAPLKAFTIKIPGDFSSAAFFIVAGLIKIPPNPPLIKGGRCISSHLGGGFRICNVGINPTRTGLLKVLKKMGAKITIKNKRMTCAEPVGDLYIFPSKLKAAHVQKNIAPSMIDEFPILSVAACFAKGTMKIDGTDELRHKESNRLVSTEKMLQSFEAGHVNSFQDHRIAMSACILGLMSSKGLSVSNPECINSSFPSFVRSFKSVGASISYRH